MKYNELSESAKDNALTNVMERVDDGDETWYYDEISRVETKLKEEGFNNPKVGNQNYKISCDLTKMTDGIFDRLTEYNTIDLLENVNLMTPKQYCVKYIEFEVDTERATVTDNNPQLEEYMKTEVFPERQSKIVNAVKSAVEYYFFSESLELEDTIEENYNNREKILQELAEDEINDYDFDENGRIVE